VSGSLRVMPESVTQMRYGSEVDSGAKKPRPEPGLKSSPKGIALDGLRAIDSAGNSVRVSGSLGVGLGQHRPHLQDTPKPDKFSFVWRANAKSLEKFDSLLAAVVRPDRCFAFNEDCASELTAGAQSWLRLADIVTRG
jgi:hypothetical protein